MLTKSLRTKSSPHNKHFDTKKTYENKYEGHKSNSSLDYKTKYKAKK